MPAALCGRNFVPDQCKAPGTREHPAVPQSADPAGPVLLSHEVVPLGRRSNGRSAGKWARERREWAVQTRERSEGAPEVLCNVARGAPGQRSGAMPALYPRTPATAPIGVRFSPIFYIIRIFSDFYDCDPPCNIVEAARACAGGGCRGGWSA